MSCELIICYTICMSLLGSEQLPRMMNMQVPKSKVWGLVVRDWKTAPQVKEGGKRQREENFTRA